MHDYRMKGGETILFEASEKALRNVRCAPNYKNRKDLSYDEKTTASRADPVARAWHAAGGEL